MITTISKLDPAAELYGEIVGLTTRNRVTSGSDCRRGEFTDHQGRTIYGWSLDRNGAPALPITNPDYPVQAITPLHH